jgi:hypothetical protein
LNSEKPLEPQDSQSHFSASESLENQGPQEPEIEIGDKCPSLGFEPINEVTWKLTDGRGSNAWDGYRGGYRTTRAVAWLMGVGGGKWVVRYRGKASRPMRLAKAKAYAIEMVKGIRPGSIVTDPIRELNLLEAKRDQGLGRGSEWPTELMGGGQQTDNKNIASNLKQVILDTELGFEASSEVPSPQGDDHQLEYYPDGYPKLPDCLRRNHG